MLNQQIKPDAMTPEQTQPPLVQLIRQRVIPQLLQLHASSGEAQDGANRVLSETQDLIEALLAGGNGESQIAALQARRVSHHDILLCVLAPAARALNDLWEQDRCSFATVTLSMWRLRGLLRSLSDAAPHPAMVARPERHILVSTLPGEQHDFGVAMVAEFFRGDGWTAHHVKPSTSADLVEEVRAARPTLVGLSISRVEALPQLRQAIAAIRRAMRRQSPAILVGGAALLHDATLAGRTGADGWALDARTALVEAGRLVELRANTFPDAATSQSPARALPATRKDRLVGLPNPSRGVSGPGTTDHRATSRGRG